MSCYKAVGRLLAILFLSFGFLVQSAGPQVAFYLNVIFPTFMIDAPALMFFYKGCYYTVEADKLAAAPKKGVLEFYEKSYATEFYLLVAEDLKRPENPEVASLETSPQHPYRFWHITAHQVESKQSTSDILQGAQAGLMVEWHVEELNNKQACMTIPDNTIIFLMDPHLIELRPSLSDRQQPFRTLPTIVFLESTDSQKLHQKATQMACVSMDFKCLHKKAVKVTRAIADNRTVVCLPAPQNRYVIG